MNRKVMPEVTAGLAVFLLGLFVLLYTFRTYDLGTPRHMGPGFYPAVLGVVTMIIAGVIVFRSFQLASEWPRVPWRPAIAICASVLAFIYGLSWFGMVPAAFLTVGIAAFADRESSPIATVVLAVFTAVTTWLIFSVGLGMPIPAFRTPF